MESVFNPSPVSAQHSLDKLSCVNFIPVLSCKSVLSTYAVAQPTDVLEKITIGHQPIDADQDASRSDPGMSMKPL